MSGTRPLKSNDLLDELADYAKFHFTAEEEAMERTGFGKAESASRSACATSVFAKRDRREKSPEPLRWSSGLVRSLHFQRAGRKQLAENTATLGRGQRQFDGHVRAVQDQR